MPLEVLRCPECGQVLGKDFEGSHISLKCHRHRPKVIVTFTLTHGYFVARCHEESHLTETGVCASITSK